VASKVYELINHCFEQLTNNVQQVCTLSANDIVCLKRARKILSENIAEPPSIMQLARTVGINDCKLKRGFKQIFNITPFGYVQELRMMQAKQSLLNGLSSVTSVANQVGYTNVGHFSAAFRKYHGSTPGNFKKNLMIMTA
jgi:AraC-like DNA-binding protein